MGEALDKAIDTSNLLAIQGFHFLFRCQIRLFVRWGISITNALGAQHHPDVAAEKPIRVGYQPELAPSPGLSSQTPLLAV